MNERTGHLSNVVGYPTFRAIHPVRHDAVGFVRASGGTTPILRREVRGGVKMVERGKVKQLVEKGLRGRS